ncbi:MAG: hypothetical protein GQ580_03635, partial [Candidatus Thorarchaeota archaeon]|nr:hypothetical protein [Candidatus Thorarchaeota archaeon]
MGGLGSYVLLGMKSLFRDMKRLYKKRGIMPVALLVIITILLKLTYDAVDDVVTFYALTGWLLEATLQSATPL